MAGRDPDDDDGAPAPPAQRARPDDDPPAPVFVCGLEVGLLDVGRVVALNGYPEACRRLAFVSSSFYLERDLLMATKRVRYGRWQRTRLMSLSRAGDVERVSFLLKVGAEIEAKDTTYGSRTPLEWAVHMGHEPVVRLLLDKGVDVGALAYQWSEVDRTREGRESIVRLLLDKGADVAATTTDGWTSLHLASFDGNEPVVRLLLDRGADVDASTTDGLTPLRIASSEGHKSVVRLLREAGAV